MIYVAAFEDFLNTFKSSASATEASATDALEDLNIDEDGLSDEYDFMEDTTDATARRRRGREKDPKKKYIEILQKVADRKASEISIELDDLTVVSTAPKDIA